MATTRKTTRKSTTRKPARKKAVAKRPASKSTARKTTAKKPVAKKKVATRKPATKKAVAKKPATARKPVAKKSPRKGKKRNNIFKSLPEVFKRDRDTGHPSMPISRNKKFTKAIDFTHNPKEDIDAKEKMQKNINPRDNDDCYVKIKVSKKKNNKYKDEPEYRDYRIHQKDRKLIEEIKSGKYKKKKS